MDEKMGGISGKIPNPLTNHLTKRERDVIIDILSNAVNPAEAIVVEDVVSTMAELEAQRQVEFNEKRKELLQFKKELDMLASITNQKTDWKHS